VRSDKVKKLSKKLLFEIEDKNRIEKVLRESEEKYKATFLTSPDSINIHTTDGVYVDINEGFTKISGYTRDDVIGKSSFEVDIWTKHKDREYLISELKSKGECNNLESVFRCKNGETVIGLMSAKIIHLDEVAHILTITRDITKQKEREKLILKTILDTEERERKRFAEDLHDELGPFLSGIKLYIKELGYQDVSYEQRLSIIEYLNEFINSAVEKTRSISNQLMPNVLTDYGLVKALNSFCTKISHTKEINIGFKSNITKNIDNSTIEVILYRIAIELINNTIKHAEANLIDISLNQFNDIIQLTYIDNGKGFDIEKELEKEKGFGLRNMINRLHSIKGNYKFLKKAKGFQLNIIIDLSLT
jgi:PAS domain S-box-containing protein